MKPRAGEQPQLASWHGIVVRLALLGVVASLALALGAAQAQAVITEPIPADVGPVPPPVPSLPTATETPPPVEAIADPVEADAVCGDWYRQSSYGGSWAAASTWWEYQCRYESPQCTGACEANWVPDVWIDYFYWDGSKAVFYGEFFGAYYLFEMMPAAVCEYWWDAPTSQWYSFARPCDGSGGAANATPTASFTVACSGSTCSFDGSASSDSDGTIADYSWAFGDGTGASGTTTTHAYAEPGSYTVTLTVTDNQGGWARDSHLVTIEPSPPPNATPTASFTLSCSGPSCSFDASASNDSDGSIEAYSWDFGDGTTGSGKTAQHDYAKGGTYTVRLTVTDNGGATGAASRNLTLISLSARGYKHTGLQKIDLSWSGPSGASFDVYRDAHKITTVQASSYTDSIDQKGQGSYVYKVCEAGTATCSNPAKVTF